MRLEIIGMAHAHLPDLLQLRYDENHRGRMIFAGQQVHRYYVNFICSNTLVLTLKMYCIHLQLLPLRSRSVRKLKELDPRFHEPLAQAGLLPFALMMAGAPMEGGGRTPLPPIEVSLLTGLVDRWRPETHTFHFPCGEMTVTLRDVAMLTGLPIRGTPLVLPRPGKEQWKSYIHGR